MLLASRDTQSHRACRSEEGLDLHVARIRCRTITRFGNKSVVPHFFGEVSVFGVSQPSAFGVRRWYKQVPQPLRSSFFLQILDLRRGRPPSLPRGWVCDMILIFDRSGRDVFLDEAKKLPPGEAGGSERARICTRQAGSMRATIGPGHWVKPHITHFGRIAGENPATLVWFIMPLGHVCSTVLAICKALKACFRASAELGHEGKERWASVLTLGTMQELRIVLSIMYNQSGEYSTPNPSQSRSFFEIQWKVS